VFSGGKRKRGKKGEEHGGSGCTWRAIEAPSRECPPVWSRGSQRHPGPKGRGGRGGQGGGGGIANKNHSAEGGRKEKTG